jgi:Tol biopolymer transport system component
MRADGTNAHAITSGSNEHYSPSWSPDGKRILYIENNFVTPKIITILPDGTGRRVLKSTVASIDTAVLSPDGARLAITDGGPQYLYNQKLGRTAVKIGGSAGYTALDWCPA